ncbi:uncharacterized protein Bfra_009715 [Botrytis fragariae]|uniref:Uncharacterized protein n=1 Tax=Botrytis fragariae TaxID=1964551 RepID=A0A8H6EFJ6_9HELO|nr:uncharacterized protein Bfra_009715 [Botrytis fragariae]KAF5870331.1 hypothetical protein Bfra_009715 [Botrytis fragariae]
MAPSGKGYPPPIPRVLRSKSGEGLPSSQAPQPQSPQPPNKASNTFSGSSRNPSPTFSNLIPKSTPRDIDPGSVSGPASQPQSLQDTTRASSRIQSRTSSRAQTGSSRPPPQDNSLPRPRDLIPRPRPRAIPHIMPRPRLTPTDRNLFLGPGQGQFQIQLQAEAPPRIDPQIRVQNQEFYTNFPSPFPTEDSPFSQSQTTTPLAIGNSHQGIHRALHQPQLPAQVHSETQNRDQHFYNNFPFPFPTAHSPFSHPQANLSSRAQDFHRGNHRDLVQASTSVQAQDETENEIWTRASKRPRFSYSHPHPNSSRNEERHGDENRDENRNRDGNETSNEIGMENETQSATQNERYNPIDTSESPLSTPPDSVSTSPPLPPLRNLPRTGTFTQSQRFDRSPTSRTRTRGGHRAENENGNVTASRTGTTNLPSSSNPSNSYTEPSILPSTLDMANRPTAAQKKWMYAVRAEGRRSDRNENGGLVGELRDRWFVCLGVWGGGCVGEIEGIGIGKGDGRWIGIG